MGSFIGHAVPGTFFFCFGVWFTLRIFQRYFASQVAGGGKGVKAGRYRNVAFFSCPCCPRVPVEGILKIVAVVLGMTGEFATAFEEGRFTHLGNAQHMTMFFFFGLNGVLDVLTHYRVPVPPDLEYVSASLAFCMEALLFYYHLHGRSHMDVQVHMLLFYVVVACAVATALEMCYKSNVLPALCRAYFTLLQGTWFYQIGFILYPPWGATWDQDDHKQMMMVTLLFTWHNAAIFVFMSLSGTMIYLRMRGGVVRAYDGLHGPALLSTKLDGEQARIMMDSDDDEAMTVLQ